MGIREAEDKLFSEWRDKIDGFCADGIPNEQLYRENHVRVMFVLRQTNDLKDDMRSHIAGFGGKRATMVNAARWAKAIHALSLSQPCLTPWSSLAWIPVDERRQILSRVCWVNINKSTGRGTSDEDFDEQALPQKELIMNQIGLYLRDEGLIPHLIVCCGTFRLFRDYFSDRLSAEYRTQVGDKYRLLDGSTPTIDYFHPASRACANHTTYNLVMSAAELLGFQTEFHMKG